MRKRLVEGQEVEAKEERIFYTSAEAGQNKWWRFVSEVDFKIAANEHEQLGDTTTLADPSVVASLVENRKNI